METTFSLPPSVFERVLASQQTLSNASPPAVSFSETASSAPYCITRGQSGRRSGDYVTDLTGSEVKRPRLSPSEQALPQKMKQQKNEQEQLKLQAIMRRLDNTRGKVLKLLKLQKARELLQQYENQADRSIDVVKGQPRYVLMKRRVPAPGNFPGSVRDGSNVSHLPSQSQGFRCVPGINIVSNRNDQRTNYSYNTLKSAGLAMDHQTLPRIIAVHSVMKNTPVNSDRRVPTISRSLVEASTTTRTEYIASNGPSSGAEQRERCRSPYMYESSEDRQTRARLPLSKQTTPGDSSFQNYEDEEVVLTKVCIGNGRFSTSTSSQRERKQDEVDLTNCNDQKNNSEHPNPGKADDPGPSGHPEHVVHPEHVDQPPKVDDPGHSDNTENTHRSDDVNHPEQEHYPGSFRNPSHPDSELYLGGPPPYLPLLNKSEMTEREKETNQQRRDSSPTSPRLTKTVTEISEKIVETRKRMKIETIDWKKCILLKLEKRLIQKLRRAEEVTGEKTEIEDLRQEVPESLSKGKKSKVKRQGGRSSRQGSVTEDGEDALESQGQLRRSSSEDSSTESVTDVDDDQEDAVERLAPERRTSRQESVTETVTDDANSEEERHSQEKTNCRQESVTDNVTDGDNVERHVGLQKQEKMEGSGHEQTESSLKEKEEICEDSHSVEMSYDQKVKIEPCENSKRTGDNEEKVSNIRKQFSSNKNQKNVELEARNTKKVDCATTEQSHDAITSQMIRKGKILDVERQDFADCGGAEMQKTELTKVSQGKVTQELKRDHDKTQRISPCKASEKFRAVHVTRDNIFEKFLSGFQAPQGPKKDKLLSSVTTEEPSLGAIRDNPVPAEEKTPGERNVTVAKNMVSGLKKRLQSCSKQALEVKPKTLDCDRNIWSTLRKGGIF